MRKGPGTRWLYRLPSHISKTELSTGAVGGATRTVRRMSRRAVAMKKNRSDMSRVYSLGHSGAEPHATTGNP